MKIKIMSCLLSVVVSFCTQFQLSAYAKEAEYISYENSYDNIQGVLINLDEIKDIENKKGSIDIVLEDTEDKKAKGNVKFSISKIANIIDGEYVLLDNYQPANIDLNSIKTAYDLNLAADILKAYDNKDNIYITDDNGKCKVDNLDIGVYLINVIDIANYDDISPFIVSIPHLNEIDYSVEYDLKVIPKHNNLENNDDNNVKLPSTGYDNKLYVYIGTGSVLLLLAALVFYKPKKKEKK